MFVLASRLLSASRCCVNFSVLTAIWKQALPYVPYAFGIGIIIPLIKADLILDKSVVDNCRCMSPVIYKLWAMIMTDCFAGNKPVNR